MRMRPSPRTRHGEQLPSGRSLSACRYLSTVRLARPVSQWVVLCLDSLTRHNPLLVASHNWLPTPCECVLERATVEQHPAPPAPPNAYPDLSDFYDDFYDAYHDNFYDNFSPSPLTMDRGIPPPNQTMLLSGVIPSTTPPLPSMCLVTINALRERTDLYTLRLPAGLRGGRGPLPARA